MVAQWAHPLLLLLDLYLLPSCKPRQEGLRIPTTEQMSGCTEPKLVSDLRNNLKSHTPVQTPTVILTRHLVILFSPPFSANTTICPDRSHPVSQRESNPRLDSTVQVVAGFGTPHLKASLRTQSEAQCTHKRQHTQLQERQGGLVTTCWACLKASGWALLAYKYPFLGLWVPLTFILPPQVRHVYQSSALHFFKTTIRGSGDGSAVNG